MEIKDMTAVQLSAAIKEGKSPYRTLWKRPLRQSKHRKNQSRIPSCG